MRQTSCADDSGSRNRKPRPATTSRPAGTADGLEMECLAGLIPPSVSLAYGTKTRARQRPQTP